MSTRAQKLTHVLDMLDMPEAVKTFLASNGVTSISRLVNSDIFDGAVDEGNMTAADAMQIAVFKRWFTSEFDPDGESITEQLTEEVWDTYIAQNHASAYRNTDAEAPNADPDEEPSDILKSNDLWRYLKVDLRSYPKFSGRIQDWVSFKRQFKAVASMQGLEDIVVKDIDDAQNEEEAALFEKKSHFIHAALTMSLAGGTAILRVEQFSASRNGHAAWKSLVDWYEGQGSTNSVAKRAMSVLHNLKLTRSTTNYVEGYIARFEEALQDLAETGHEYDSVMKKITFLAGIIDPSVKNYVDILRLDDNKSYEDCVMDIRRFSFEILDRDRPNFGGARGNHRYVNQVQGSQRAQHGASDQVVNPGFIQGHVWRGMSSVERERVLAARRTSGGHARGRGNSARGGHSGRGQGQSRDRGGPQRTPNTQAAIRQVTETSGGGNQHAIAVRRARVNFVQGTENMPTTRHQVNQVRSMASVMSIDEIDDATLENEEDEWFFAEPETQQQVENFQIVDRFPDDDSIQSWMSTNTATYPFGNPNTLYASVMMVVSENNQARYPHQHRSRANNFEETNDDQTDRAKILSSVTLDAGASVSVVGMDALILRVYTETYTLMGYDNNGEELVVPVVDAVVAIEQGDNYVLIGFHRAAYVSTNESCLLSPHESRSCNWRTDDRRPEHGGSMRMRRANQGTQRINTLYLQRIGTALGFKIALNNFSLKVMYNECPLSFVERVNWVTADANDMTMQERFFDFYLQGERALSDQIIRHVQSTIYRETDAASWSSDEDFELPEERDQHRSLTPFKEEWDSDLSLTSDADPNETGDGGPDFVPLSPEDVKQENMDDDNINSDFFDYHVVNTDEALQNSMQNLTLAKNPETWSKGEHKSVCRTYLVENPRARDDDHATPPTDSPTDFTNGQGAHQAASQHQANFIDNAQTRATTGLLTNQANNYQEENDIFIDADQHTPKKKRKDPRELHQPLSNPKFDIQTIVPRLGYLPESTIKRTLHSTTQMVPDYNVAIPFKRHFKARFPQFNRRRLQESFATDTFFSSVAALGGFECVQLFVGVTSKFTAVYAMHNEAQGSIALEDFIRDYGAPYHLVSDNSKMQHGKLFTSVCRKYNISQSWVEPHHQHQNHAERRIQDVKRQVNLILDRSGAPEDTWLLCVQYVVYLLNRTALHTLNDETPYQVMYGETPDISNLLQFSFYEPVYYHDPTAPFPHTKEALGHFVGIAENIGDSMTFKILSQESCEIIHRSTVRSAASGRSSPNRRLTIQHGEANHNTKTIVESLNDTMLKGEAPVIDPETLIGRKFMEAKNGIPMRKTIKKYDKERNNFEITSPNKGSEFLTYNQVIDKLNENQEGKDDIWMFESIIGHRRKGRRIEVKVKWSEGSTTWEPLSVMRESDPLTLARYAEENNLLETRGWKWAKEKEREIKHYIRNVTGETQKNETKKKRKFKKSLPKYKFGVQVPRGTRQALDLDKANGNTLWKESMEKEVKGLLDFETFQILEEGSRPPEGHSFIPLHAVYDCKVDGRRKCRIVANGAQAPVNEDQDLYAGVVSVDVVRLLFVIASINKMNVWATDISMAYLHGVTREKLWTRAGPEFGPLEGRIMRIHKSIYGLVSSGSVFHEVLSDTLRQMGWTPTYADPNVWIKDKGDHYEYIATHVDDLLIVSRNPSEIIKNLEKRYDLKGTGVPEHYLGGNVDQHKNEQKKDDVTWSQSARTYITNVTAKIEKMFEVELRHYQSPMDSSYKPEIDDTRLLTPLEITKYQMLVGCANWVITLGRWDVYYATVTLARYNVAPREGHQKAMLRIFGYLKHYKKWKITYDIRRLPVDESKFTTRNWEEIYPGMKEEMPHNMPKPKGEAVKLTGYFDADHASDVVSRRSVTGVMMMANSTPVRWLCKRQNTVETSTYGSEIVASRIAIDIAVEMRYKLRMMGVPIDGPVDLYGDNQSVIANTTIPSSVLKKKHNACAWHRTREAVAASIVRIAYIKSALNIADVFTKALGPIIYERLVKPYFTKIGNGQTEGEC